MATTVPAPRVRVDLESVQRGRTGWRVSWRVEARGEQPITVTEAWHPHGRFYSSRLARSLRVRPGSAASLEVPARSDVAAGERVENCFLILRARSGGRSWRILTRFTVEVGDDGVPVPRVEAVDVHPAERSPSGR